MFVIEYNSLNQVFKFISLKHLIFKKAILSEIFTSVELSFFTSKRKVLSGCPIKHKF
jgi:hypothetical protein